MLHARPADGTPSGKWFAEAFEIVELRMAEHLDGTCSGKRIVEAVPGRGGCRRSEDGRCVLMRIAAQMRKTTTQNATAAATAWFRVTENPRGLRSESWMLTIGIPPVN